MSALLPLRKDNKKGPRAPFLAPIWMLLAVALTTGNIPFWLVQYAFRRPKAFSGVLEFLAFRFIRTFLTVFPYVPPGNFLGDAKRAPTKGPWDKVSTITVAVLPVPADWRTHYAEDVPEVQAIERPGFMVTPPQAKASGAALAADGERAIIYLHGGAYVLGDPVSTPFAAKIAVEAGVRVLGVQYSLCRDEATAFPAPLLDALAAFRYLTESLSFEPGNIVVLGESAGGHLTLSLATQLAASGRPLPGALALCSPWVDMTMGFNSWKTNTDDYLPTAWLAKSSHSAARHYAPEAVEGAFFSPALATPRSGHWAFLKDVPVFITLGTAEVFADEIDVLTKTMQDDGVDAKLWKDEDGIHIRPLLPGHDKEYAHYRDGILELLKKIEAKADAKGAAEAEAGTQ